MVFVAFELMPLLLDHFVQAVFSALAKQTAGTFSCIFFFFNFLSLYFLYYRFWIFSSMNSIFLLKVVPFSSSFLFLCGVLILPYLKLVCFFFCIRVQTKRLVLFLFGAV